MDIPEQFHFTYRRMVEFADTDVAGIMHFSNFFRFVECAEHAFLRSLGQPVHRIDGEGHFGWPRLEVSCSYFKPARFEQTLEICLRIEEIRTSSLRYAFWIFADGEAGRPPLAHGSFSIVHVKIDPAAHGLTKTPIPSDLRKRLESAVASSPPRS